MKFKKTEIIVRKLNPKRPKILAVYFCIVNLYPVAVLCADCRDEAKLIQTFFQEKTATITF